MATAITWPLSLPQLFQHDGFAQGKQGNLLRTDMDSGLPKVRRLFTAISKYPSGTMIMTGSQLTDFEDFFDNTIFSGSLTFNFPNPFDYGATTIEMRFRISTKEEPYSIVPDGGTLDWQVVLNLETIP